MKIREIVLSRLGLFRSAVLAAYTAGKDCIYFNKRCIPFSGRPDQPDTLLEIEIEGTKYSLAQGLINAAKLAERGYLGPDVELFGVSVLASRNERGADKRRSRRKIRCAELRKTMSRIWPPEMVERVLQWDMMKNDQVQEEWVAAGREGAPQFDRSARSEVVAENVLAVLAHVKGGGEIPATYQDAVGAGIKLRFVTPERWESVKVLAAVLAWRKPKHKKPGSGHRRDRDERHWGRHENKANENGTGGTSNPV